MGLGKKLDALLKMKGIRVSTLADDLNLNRNSLYSLIKRDSGKMDMDVLSLIADYAGVSIDYFFSNAPAEAVLNANQQRLIDAYNSANNKAQIVIVDLAESLAKAFPAETPSRTSSPSAPLPFPAPDDEPETVHYAKQPTWERRMKMAGAAAHDYDGESPYRSIDDRDEHKFDAP